WPCCYRDDARSLMAEKCPDGYEIVKEEEVVVGQKATTGPGDHRLPAGLNDPHDQENVGRVVTTTDRTEYRLHFRSKGTAADPAPAAVQQAASHTPADPPLVAAPDAPLIPPPPGAGPGS